MIKVFAAILFLAVSLFSYGQTITVLASKPGVSLRGLSVVNDHVLWASGSKGMVVRSIDGGKSFDWLTVAGYEARDFRDVEAFDANTAVIMAIAEPAVILKTKDGGKTWKKAFEDSTKGMFLDAMDFSGKHGMVIGDPVNNKMYAANTTDGGDTWHTLNDEVELAVGEAFFASSGTNVKLLPMQKNRFQYMAVSGGTEANFIKIGKMKLDLVQGKESQGANSVALNKGMKNIVVVGGDFMKDKETAGNCVWSVDFGKTWQPPQTPPHGYRSCVAFIDEKKLIACGTSGVDVSDDGGDNWRLISEESFHVCQKAKQGTAVFVAGKEGRIGKVKF